MTQIDHANVRRLIGEGLNIERNSPTCVAVRSHLESCDECRQYVESLEKTIDCYKSYDIPKPEDLDSRLNSALDSFATGS